MLWKVAADKSPYELKIANKAQEMLIDLYQLYHLRPQRMIGLRRCLKNIREGTDVAVSVKVTCAVLVHMPLTASNLDKTSRFDPIQFNFVSCSLTFFFFKVFVALALIIYV